MGGLGDDLGAGIVGCQKQCWYADIGPAIYDHVHIVCEQQGGGDVIGVERDHLVISATASHGRVGISPGQA
jgi:hypothetical protein